MAQIAGGVAPTLSLGGLVIAVQRRPAEFARTLTLLAVVRNLLAQDRYASLRDVFYRDVALYGTQAVSDGVVSRVAAALGVRREVLHVHPAARGLAVGRLRWTSLGRVHDASVAAQGVPIGPVLADVATDAAFVLVVEKECVFSRMVAARFHERHDAVLITGRGYPDENTLRLCNELSLLDVPMWALVDCDPYGVDIYLDYVAGRATQLANAKRDPMAGFLRSPRLQWLGVTPVDVEMLHVPAHRRLPLSARDLRKLTALGKHPAVVADAHLAGQIARMRRADFKVEIQGVASDGAPGAQQSRDGDNVEAFVAAKLGLPAAHSSPSPES